MPEEIPDLWPADIGTGKLQSPVAILRREASLLGEKTSQLVTAEVTTQSQGEHFIHAFILVCPALDNYRYELFKVQHRLTFYPMTFITGGGGISLSTQEEFLGRLRVIFSSQDTKNIVHSLLAQISP